ncbi:MAG: hypothetical protein MUO62_04980, partial [Anaerolineales bacterium]|nr:hypothetical protein [Anaerolineales bacterium]
QTKQYTSQHFIFLLEKSLIDWIQLLDPRDDMKLYLTACLDFSFSWEPGAWCMPGSWFIFLSMERVIA